MLLDGEGEARELLHVPVVEAELAACAARSLLHAHPVLGEHHSIRLGAESSSQDGGTSRAQCGLEGAELIRVDVSLNQRLTEPPGRVHEHDVGKARFGIQTKHHPARSEVGAHHALHARGKGHFGMLEAVVYAVRDGAVGVERREYPRERGEDLLGPAHVQQGFLLAGEGRLGQVLRRRGGAHRDAALDFAVGEFGIGPHDRVRQIGPQFRLLDPPPNPSPARRERVQVLDVEMGEFTGNALVEPVTGNELPECGSGGGETARHPHPRRAEFSVHLPEGGVLPSDLLHIIDAERIEADDVLHDKGFRDAWE